MFKSYFFNSRYFNSNTFQNQPVISNNPVYVSFTQAWRTWLGMRIRKYYYR